MEFSKSRSNNGKGFHVPILKIASLLIFRFSFFAPDVAFQLMKINNYKEA